MLLCMRKWAAATALAIAPFPVLAVSAEAEPECNVSVCFDGTWGDMKVAAPPFAVEQPVSNEVVSELVMSHLTSDETIAGHETTYMVQYAELEKILEQTQVP